MYNCTQYTVLGYSLDLRATHDGAFSSRNRLHSRRIRGMVWPSVCVTISVGHAVSEHANAYLSGIAQVDNAKSLANATQSLATAGSVPDSIHEIRALNHVLRLLRSIIVPGTHA